MKSAAEIGLAAKTSTTTNPFAQAWENTTSPNLVPSVFGALPYSMPPNSASAAFNYNTFTFSSPRGTILNSVVTGPRSQKYYRITTDSTERGFSIVQNFGGEIIAVIEWRKHPTVEIFGAVSKTTSARWLMLSPSKECALLLFHEKRSIIPAFTDSDS